MSDKRFHLGWFTYFGQNAWNEPLAAQGEPWTGDLHLDLARAMERACFDYMLDRGHAEHSGGAWRELGDLPQARDHGAEA